MGGTWTSRMAVCRGGKCGRRPRPCPQGNHSWLGARLWSGVFLHKSQRSKNSRAPTSETVHHPVSRAPALGRLQRGSLGQRAFLWGPGLLLVQEWSSHPNATDLASPSFLLGIF